MPVEAVQYRRWPGRCRARGARQRSAAAVHRADRYDNGAGSMQIRLLSLFPVVDAHGLEMDVSALIIFVNDVLMWPL
jgi:hypothetical protein